MFTQKLWGNSEDLFVIGLVVQHLSWDRSNSWAPWNRRCSSLELPLSVRLSEELLDLMLQIKGTFEQRENFLWPDLFIISLKVHRLQSSVCALLCVSSHGVCGGQDDHVDRFPQHFNQVRDNYNNRWKLLCDRYQTSLQPLSVSQHPLCW